MRPEARVLAFRRHIVFGRSLLGKMERGGDGRQRRSLLIVAPGIDQT
jgi:hypothetical protein